MDASEAARALGRCNKGKPKTLTKKEAARRRKSLAVAREKRWPKKPQNSITGGR